MTISELSRKCTDTLSRRFSRGEAEWMARLMMEDVFHRSRTDLLIDGHKPASESRIEIINKMIARLLDGEPLQYILGYETFMGIRFKVTPDVLIPRPETQELVQLIIDSESSREDLNVLDCGTGSGCIAIALSRYLRFPHITAIDISIEALAVARENADLLKVRNVKWEQADILSLPTPIAPLYDLIVSNPPYVLDSERAAMERNILDHEPHCALFVPDDDPLRFYTAIARYARKALVDGGRIYFELNPLTAARLRRIMTDDGWNNVELHPDCHGRKRFLTASL